MERTFSVDIQGPPDPVWDMITTGAGLSTWFVSDAQVTPGPGGRVVLDWGQDEKGYGAIEEWEPPKRLRIGYETATGESVGGHEQWLLVHSPRLTTVQLSVVVPGDGPWEDDDMTRGWTLFLANLRFAVESKHKRRTSVMRSVPLAGSRSLAWTRMTVAIGLPPVAGTGKDVFIKDVGQATVLASFPDHSVLLAFGTKATLLLDFEGEPASLYALASTYGPDTPELNELREKLVATADRAGAAITT